ncbi:MAG: DUF4254 domain-containing protein [Gloeobacteraceae cyanobacterium ES-bin-316]|nr:DUF4254 domain-containing protein [Ferruginibacter sp.]
MISSICNNIFEKSINDYHISDHVDTAINNPFEKSSFEHLLYFKNWIDTVQWHLEDLIRDPQIEPAAALQLKRRIDLSNQERTDMVEFIDTYFLEKYKAIAVRENAGINTESPAWAVDRLSILALKIYHMQQEAQRADASEEHREACRNKLAVLLEQRKDLSQAIDNLMNEIRDGLKYMKVYKQMKMYNDESLNPVLYNQQSS